MTTIRIRWARFTLSALRNPQRFAWDSRNGNLFVADIGQNIVEEVEPGDEGREPRLERVGRKLRLHQPRRR